MLSTRIPLEHPPPPPPQAEHPKIQITVRHRNILSPSSKCNVLSDKRPLKNDQSILKLVRPSQKVRRETIENNLTILCGHIICRDVKSRANKHVRQSEIERFVTKCVVEVLKHFKESLKKARRRGPFETTPRIQIVLKGMSLYGYG